MASWHTVGTKSFSVSVTSPPTITWEVEAPQTVKPGDTVYVNVKVYANKQVQVRATVGLFGTSQQKTGTAYSTTTPSIITFQFKAPTTEGPYNGSVKLEAYY